MAREGDALCPSAEKEGDQPDQRPVSDGLPGSGSRHRETDGAETEGIPITELIGVMYVPGKDSGRSWPGAKEMFLGKRVKDKVTGFSGVATRWSIGMDGSVRLWVEGQSAADGSARERWVDGHRVEEVKEGSTGAYA